MYKDPILTILAELRLLLSAREDEIAGLKLQIINTRIKITELESKVMNLTENALKDTINNG